VSWLWIDAGGASVWLPAVLLLGAIVGYTAGLFGVGGGFLLTPLLSVVFGVPLQVAVGTGLCQMVGTSLASFVKHRRLAQGESRVAILLAAGTFLGVEAGARTVTTLHDLGAVRVFARDILWIDLVAKSALAIILAVIAFLSWRRRTLIEATPPRPGPLARLQLGPRVFLPAVGFDAPAIVIAYLGLILGFLSGLFGVGGGIALFPLLVYGFGFPLRHAAATGMGLMVATAAIGTFTHALRGHVSLPLAMALLVGSTMTAQLGALATRRFAAGRLHAGFALLTLLLAASLLWDVARRLS
jgi:uncharacterized membrane protein YfcA